MNSKSDAVRMFDPQDLLEMGTLPDNATVEQQIELYKKIMKKSEESYYAESSRVVNAKNSFLQTWRLYSKSQFSRKELNVSNNLFK